MTVAFNSKMMEKHKKLKKVLTGRLLRQRVKKQNKNLTGKYLVCVLLATDSHQDPSQAVKQLLRMKITNFLSIFNNNY